MYSPIVSLLVRRAFARLGDGDPSAILAMFGPGAHFRFPGSSSWAIDTTDQAAIEAWFVRFAAERPRFTIHDVVAQGPPWAMRVRTQGTDVIDRPDGTTYRNEWAQALLLRWGKVREDIIYVDTERVATLDALV